MSNNIIIKHCAPTLAGLKIGNLFTYDFDSMYYLEQIIKRYNELLNTKGVYMLVLKTYKGKALIYVYRKNKLSSLLHDIEIQKFLRSYGYEQFDLDFCLNQLKTHLSNTDFPHEIGVFLGYPLSDIIGFI